MKTECNTCNGKGEAVFSCCGGDVVIDDMMMCPTCHEHLGPETCPDCEGTGMVEEEDQTDPIKIDMQARAEDMRDFRDFRESDPYHHSGLKDY